MKGGIGVENGSAAAGVGGKRWKIFGGQIHMGNLWIVRALSNVYSFLNPSLR